jgi:hypothetical protein
MKKLILGVFLILSADLLAQEKLLSDTIAVKSIDGIVNEILEIISVEKGESIDLDKFRNLFVPNARFSMLMPNDSIPQPLETVSLEEFAEMLDDPYYEEGYLEYELGKVVDEYNGIAHVFQSFYGKDSEGVEERGITSYQLVFFNDRWWIVNILWTTDGNGVEIPEKYKGN